MIKVSTLGGRGVEARMDMIARRRVNVAADTCYGDLCAVCGEGGGRGVWTS